MKNIKYYILALLTIFLFSYTNISAATLSVGVSPTNEKLKMNPGDEDSGEIVFWNLSEDTTKYKVIVRGFNQVNNMPGTAIVMTEEEDKNALYSASSWFTLSASEIELVPNKNIKIQYTINVPADAAEGEYTAEIFLLSSSDNSNEEGTFTNTVLGSGVPVLIQIGEDYVESAELLIFQTDKKIYEFPDVTFSTQIRNLGNMHISPVGEIAVTNIFGQEVARIKFNENNQSLLRETSGTYEDKWYDKSLLSEENEIMFGPMKATLVSTYRTVSPGFSPLTAETTFWIIPWKIILGLAVAIALIILIIKRKKK